MTTMEVAKIKKMVNVCDQGSTRSANVITPRKGFAIRLSAKERKNKDGDVIVREGAPFWVVLGEWGITACAGDKDKPNDKVLVFSTEKEAEELMAERSVIALSVDVRSWEIVPIVAETKRVFKCYSVERRD